MNLNTKGLIAALLLLFAPVCTLQAQSDLGQMQWIVGNWKGESLKTTYSEHWQSNGTGFTGRGIVLRKVTKDTLSSEDLLLLELAGKPVYRVVVKNQNKGQFIDFPLKESVAGEAVFENLAHDFPQRIIYRQIGSDSLTAIAEGSNERGKIVKQVFRYGRKK